MPPARAKPPPTPVAAVSRDICPVCRQNRYLDKTLEFLINPECYHEMCSVCIERIFSAGPAPCPVPYCGKTLRKRGFHKSFFEDLKVEREVDVRKRVGLVYNRRQDDFETLLDWNNYLEEVEGLVFDILQGGRGKDDAEEKMRAYVEGHRGDIEANRLQQVEEGERGRMAQETERERARMRREAEARAEADERKEIECLNQQMLDKLQRGEGDAVEVTRRTQRVLLKKSSARKRLVDDQRAQGGKERDYGLSIRGLKKKMNPVLEGPYDPFGGRSWTPTRYTVLDDYGYKFYDEMKRNTAMMAGGSDMREFYARCMADAFGGLGICVEDEVRDRASTVASTGTGEAPRPMEADVPKVKPVRESDDVF